MTTTDRRPTHLHDKDAKTTRCGIKMNSDKRFPYVAAEHAQAHIDGYGMPVCADCQPRKRYIPRQRKRIVKRSC